MKCVEITFKKHHNYPQIPAEMTPKNLPQKLLIYHETNHKNWVKYVELPLKHQNYIQNPPKMIQQSVEII